MNSDYTFLISWNGKQLINRFCRTLSANTQLGTWLFVHNTTREWGAVITVDEKKKMNAEQSDKTSVLRIGREAMGGLVSITIFLNFGLDHFTGTSRNTYDVIQVWHRTPIFTVLGLRTGGMWRDIPIVVITVTVTVIVAGDTTIQFNDSSSSSSRYVNRKTLQTQNSWTYYLTDCEYYYAWNRGEYSVSSKYCTETKPGARENKNGK